MAASAAPPAADASATAAYAFIALVALAALAAGGALLWRHGQAQGVAAARKAWAEEAAAAAQQPASLADEAARVTVVTHNPMSGAAAGTFGRARAPGFTEGSR